MKLTENDFDVVNFPGGAKTPASNLNIVKPGTAIPTSNLDLLERSVETECPHFANLVFKATDAYECDENSHPVRQGIETSCEHLQEDETCGATGETCVLSPLSSNNVHGDVFSNDMEITAEVFLSVEAEEGTFK